MQHASKRAWAVLGAALMVGVILVVPTAGAEPFNQKTCEEQGGTWEQSGGEKSCTITTTPGVGPEGEGNAGGAKKTDTESGKGNPSNEQSPQQEWEDEQCNVNRHGKVTGCR